MRRIAQAINDDRACDRMPILADAREDAGCDNADILNHCRNGGEHVRGCWVIGLLLGKEQPTPRRHSATAASLCLVILCLLS